MLRRRRLSRAGRALPNGEFRGWSCRRHHRDDPAEMRPAARRRRRFWREAIVAAMRPAAAPAGPGHGGSFRCSPESAGATRPVSNGAPDAGNQSKADSARKQAKQHHAKSQIEHRLPNAQFPFTLSILSHAASCRPATLMSTGWKHPHSVVRLVPINQRASGSCSSHSTSSRSFGGKGVSANYYEFNAGREQCGQHLCDVAVHDPVLL